jgi:hypothetical protein
MAAAIPVGTEEFREPPQFGGGGASTLVFSCSSGRLLDYIGPDAILGRELLERLATNSSPSFGTTGVR